MKIHPFSIGPIVGSVTGRSIRLWGRGLNDVNSGEDIPRIGVAQIKKANEKQEFCNLQEFPLNPAYDYTGVIEFIDLEPNTAYQYQIGCCPQNYNLQRLDWQQAHSGVITTGSEDLCQSRTFIFGSCRYLLRLRNFFFGGGGDRTFKAILNQHKQQPIDQFIMLGDQIYADDLKGFSPDTEMSDFNLRYRRAFAQPNLRKLMAHVPTYMMLDDHEIENNWPTQASAKDLENDGKYDNAIRAFHSYQLRHSPAFDINRIDEPLKHHWYQFQDGCCDFFVADTRTERSLEKKQIISTTQMKALKNWLVDGSDIVKIIASPVLIFPDFKKGNDDQWSGFPHQRRELLDHIRHNQIKRVIFLSGDVHASLSAELTYKGDDTFKVISIVSSPFSWPTCHGRKSKFKLTGLLGSTFYEVSNASDVMSNDNFTQVKVSLDGVQIVIFPQGHPSKIWRRQTRIEKHYQF